MEIKNNPPRMFNLWVIFLQDGKVIFKNEQITISNSMVNQMILFVKNGDLFENSINYNLKKKGFKLF